MSQAYLSYEAAPPPWLPGSFFAASLLWLLLTGLTLLLGTAITVNRFDPLVVTLTHLLTLGVLGNGMLGALLQLLAVASGLETPRPRRLWCAVFPCWQLGVASLCWGFSHGFSARWLPAGALLLGMAALSLLWHAGRGLWRSPARDATSQGIRLALIGLAVALGLGLLLALTLSGYLRLPFIALLHSHVLWAGLGWLLALLLAVSQTIMPMFLITPAYPPRTARLLPMQISLLAGLTLLLLLRPAWTEWLLMLAGLPAAGYAMLTLRQLRASRRRQDPLWRSWLLGMLCLLLALPTAAASLWWPQSGSLALWCGLLWLGGLCLAIMLGMLGKIAPFLAWLHLQQLQPPRGMLPSTHGFLSEQAVTRLGSLHAVWLLAGLAWCRWPAAWQTVLAMLTLILATLAGWHALQLWRRYHAIRRHCLQRAMPATGHGSAPG